MTRQPDWSAFDDIICINLIDRDDRYKAAQKVFESLQIPVRFHRVKKDPNGGEAGCYSSHLEVIRDSYQQGYQRVLIFEDDAIPTAAYSPTRMTECIDFMKTNSDWDLFFLGYVHNFHHMFSSNMRPVAGNIVKINGFATSSYCINRKFMKYLLDNYPTYQGTAIDLSFYGKGDQYSIYPMLFRQNTSYESDIAHSDLGNLNDLLIKLTYTVDQYIFLNGLLEHLNRYRKQIWGLIFAIAAVMIYLFYRRQRTA